MKRGPSAQLSLFDAPAPGPAAVASPSIAGAGYRAALVEQIARDRQTLRLGPDYWHPDRAFYVDRIASLVEAVKGL